MEISWPWIVAAVVLFFPALFAFLVFSVVFLRLAAECAIKLCEWLGLDK